MRAKDRNNNTPAPITRTVHYSHFRERHVAGCHNPVNPKQNINTTPLSLWLATLGTGICGISIKVRRCGQPKPRLGC